jgi:hypothetical protein
MSIAVITDRVASSSLEKGGVPLMMIMVLPVVSI